MAQHRKTTERSTRARTVVGGAVAAGALFIVAPAGAALAQPTEGNNFGGKTHFEPHFIHFIEHTFCHHKTTGGSTL